MEFGDVKAWDVYLATTTEKAPAVGRVGTSSPLRSQQTTWLMGTFWSLIRKYVYCKTSSTL